MTKRGNPRKPTKRPTTPTPTPTPKAVASTGRAAISLPATDPLDTEFKAMMSATRNRCGTCRSFRLTPGKDTGECRAEFPIADVEDGSRAVWPNGIDPETGWCAQWETL